MDRHPRFLVGLLLVFVMSVVVYGENSEAIDLRLHLQKGMVFTQRVSVEQNIIQQFQELNNEMHQIMHFDYGQEVLNVDEFENADVRMTYKSVYIKQQGIGGTFEYDSDHTEGEIPAAAKGLAALIGAQLTVRISPKGEILQIQGLDLMMNQVIKKMKCPPGPQQEAIKKMYSLKNMTGAMGQLIGPYPKTPVENGDIWSVNAESHQNFPMMTDTFYKLKERKDGRILISLSSMIKSPPNVEPVRMGSLRLIYNISGHSSGTMIIGERTGLVLREEVTQDFSGNVKAEGLQGSSSATWPISVKTLMTREIIN